MDPQNDDSLSILGVPAVCPCCLQTVANFYLAFEQDLVLLPVLNKVDLPSADPEAATEQMVATFDIDPTSMHLFECRQGG
jgi:translation elongation factor EF-4